MFYFCNSCNTWGCFLNQLLNSCNCALVKTLAFVQITLITPGLAPSVSARLCDAQLFSHSFFARGHLTANKTFLLLQFCSFPEPLYGVPCQFRVHWALYHVFLNYQQNQQAYSPHLVWIVFFIIFHFPSSSLNWTSRSVGSHVSCLKCSACSSFYSHLSHSHSCLLSYPQTYFALVFLIVYRSS